MLFRCTRLGRRARGSLSVSFAAAAAANFLFKASLTLICNFKAAYRWASLFTELGVSFCFSAAMANLLFKASLTLICNFKAANK